MGKISIEVEEPDFFIRGTMAGAMIEFGDGKIKSFSDFLARVKLK